MFYLLLSNIYFISEGDTESRRAAHQLKELQNDIERQAQTHQALRNSSLALLGSLTQEDALMLQLRGDEMERRWQVGFNVFMDLFIFSSPASCNY